LLYLVSSKKTAILYRLKSAGQLFCVLIIQGRGAVHMAGAGVSSGQQGVPYREKRTAYRQKLLVYQWI